MSKISSRVNSWALRTPPAGAYRDHGLESLEARTLLANAPLPLLTSMENPNNTVVRLETTLGLIDIELFDSLAPITVANYLNYVTSGRLDNTFFHRSQRNSSLPWILQGGGFYYDNTEGLSAVPADAPISREITAHINLAYTVAMAQPDGLNSATSQFFINYAHNPALNPTAPDNGFAVFGRIIQGTGVVDSIRSLRSIDMSSNTSFAGHPAAPEFTQFPIATSHMVGLPIREADLIWIVNAEVIKPASFSGFFNQRFVIPEGYRSGNSVETLDVYNPNEVAASYQVILHYETGRRDSVVATGTIGAGASLRIRLSDSGDPSLDLVRPNTPYAVVLEAALPSDTADPKYLATSSSRVDFNAEIREALFNADDIPNIRHFSFSHVEHHENSLEFISWVNLSDRAGIVSVALWSFDGYQGQLRFDVEPYRRGGMALGDYPALPRTTFAVQVTSGLPFVPFVSDWDVPAPGQDPATSYTPGFGSMGVPSIPRQVSAFSDVVMEESFTSTISLHNYTGVPFGPAARLRFWRSNRAPGEPPIEKVVRVDFRFDYTLLPEHLGIPYGEHFSVTISGLGFTAHYTQVDNRGRNLAGTRHSDGISTVASYTVNPAAHFAGGSLDPTRTDESQIERIGIFNPYASASLVFTYTVRYSFSDGTFIDAFTGTLGAHGRVDLYSGDSAAVRAKASSDPQFRHYAISVLGQVNDGANVTQTSGVVQLTRIDQATGRWTTQAPSPGREIGELGVSLRGSVFGLYP